MKLPIKKDFLIFANNPDLIYLDSSATSQTPEAVIECMTRYYQEYRANTRRGQYTIGEKAEKAYEDARAQVAQFIGGNPREIIFTAGSTASANLLLYALENSKIFKQGDEIVTTIMEHHSLFVPLQKLAERKNLVLRVIPMDENFELNYTSAEKFITKKTKLLAFVGASNVTGTIHDMKRLCDMARKSGAYSLIDATQAIGHIPFDIKKTGCDFLFFSGHKMCGPTGIGVLYGRQEILEKLEPGYYGGGMIEEVTQKEVKFAPLPHKFEAGTPNIAGAIGLGAACEYLNAIGLEKIKDHLTSMIAYALPKLKAIKGVKLYCHHDPKKNIGIISFAVGVLHPHDIGEILSRRNIAIRGGHHCAMPLVTFMGISSLNRASFYLYTSKRDVNALVRGIREAQNFFDSI